VYIFELSPGVTEPLVLSLFLLVSLVLGSSARPPEAPGSSVPHLRQQQHPTPPYTAHLCQCHCISHSFVSVPLHLLLICISAIASPAHLCQCHCTFCSVVSVPLHPPLICISANASPAHLCQCHCISCSFVSVPLHILLSCVSAIAHCAQLCQCH